jgi:hypothetical protein
MAQPLLRARMPRLFMLSLVVMFVALLFSAPVVRADDDEELSRDQYVSMGIDVPKVLAHVTQFPTPAAAGNHSRFAYVMIHYEGTPKDDMYVLGTRVVIKSILDTGSKQDVVILCADNVRESTKKQFRDVGAIIKEVPNIPNPYKATQQARRTYKSRFEFTFNKLYIWNLVEYERVMYLDADNLIVRNVDELFLCGHYCNAFFNPLFFHTGMMVVKPDHAIFHSLVESLLTVKIFSYDGADQGFLTAAFPALDKAPLFNATAMLASGGRPSEAPLMRFPMEYNFNSVFWYPHFSYDYYRRAKHPFSADTVGLPIGSIAYCIGPLFKPWNWFPHIFFHTVRAWNAVRMSLPDSHATFVVSISLQLLAIATLGFLAAATLPQLKAIDSLRVHARAAVIVIGVRATASALGVGSFLLAIYIAVTQVHQQVPPIYAWTVFAALMILVPFTVLQVFVVLVAPPRAPHAAGSPLSDSAPGAGADGALDKGARLPTAVLPPLGATLAQAAAVVLTLDYFTVTPGTGARARFGSAVASANDDDLDLDSSVLSVHLHSPRAVGAGAGAGAGGEGEYALVGGAGGARGGVASAADGLDDLEDPDWTDGGIPLIPLDGSAPAADKASKRAGAGAGIGARAAAAGGASAGLAASAADGGAGYVGSQATTAAAQLRSGVTLALMLPVFFALIGGFYVLIVADWHFHFVEKIIFLIMAIWALLYSIMHVFRRVAAVAFLVPGTVGPIFL